MGEVSGIFLQFFKEMWITKGCWINWPSRCQVSGLSEWVGAQLRQLDAIPSYAIVMCVCIMITIFTEFTSNVATATIFLPILASLVSFLILIIVLPRSWRTLQNNELNEVTSSKKQKVFNGWSSKELWALTEEYSMSKYKYISISSVDQSNFHRNAH